MTLDADVLIVGAGPVGLAVATLLGRAGRDVLVVESRLATTPVDESRAITWMPEGLLFADELGITDELRAVASIRTRHEFRRHAGGDSMLTLRLDELHHRHPYSLNLPQHVSERLLEQEALATGRVRLERGLVVTGANQTDAGVQSITIDRGGEQSTVTAALGIAADGAGSTRSGVASMLGIGGDYTSYGARSVVADV